MSVYTYVCTYVVAHTYTHMCIELLMSGCRELLSIQSLSVTLIQSDVVISLYEVRDEIYKVCVLLYQRTLR
jgi:hypothetical protein